MGLVSVRLFANLREIVGNPRLVFEASTIRDVLMTLRSEHPALQPLLSDDGEVRPYSPSSQSSGCNAGCSDRSVISTSRMVLASKTSSGLPTISRRFANKRTFTSPITFLLQYFHYKYFLSSWQEHTYI